MNVQKSPFTGIHLPVLIKIIHEGQNINIRQVSKELFSLFDKAMEQKWNFFLKEEGENNGFILKNINERGVNYRFEMNKKGACSPGLRKFKVFFNSCSQEMIQRVFICSSYKELMELKKANDHSVCSMVKKMQDQQNSSTWHKDQHIRLLSDTPQNARRDLRFVEKNHRLRNACLTWDWDKTLVFTNYNGKYFPAEFCHTFKNLKSLMLIGAINLASLPPEIYLMKNLEELILIGTGITLMKTGISYLPQEICKINLKSLIITKLKPLYNTFKEKITACHPSNLCPFSKLSSIETFLIGNNNPSSIRVAHVSEKGERLFIKVEVPPVQERGSSPLDNFNIPLKSYDIIALECNDNKDQWTLPNNNNYKFDPSTPFKIVKTDKLGGNYVEEQGENRRYFTDDLIKKAESYLSNLRGKQLWKIFIVPRF